jgi:hypothetical protein
MNLIGRSRRTIGAQSPFYDTFADAANIGALKVVLYGSRRDTAPAARFGSASRP